MNRRRLLPILAPLLALACGGPGGEDNAFATVALEGDGDGDETGSTTNPGEDGLSEDQQGRIWTGGKGVGADYVGWVDKATVTAGDAIVLQGDFPKGVSVDIDGYVWGVGGTTAVRVDPNNYSQQTVSGLNGAYTYSDMTGGALFNVACPEG